MENHCCGCDRIDTANFLHNKKYRLRHQDSLGLLFNAREVIYILKNDMKI